MPTPEAKPSTHFIRNIILDDLKSGREKAVITRFPTEPNGYLHIGHAKSICLNFGIVQEFGGQCFMRFDDTNPVKEDEEYEQSILQDVRWMGFDWEERLTHASDYFEQLYGYAEDLIQQGKAYVDSLSAEEIRAQRGTLTAPGQDSPHRDRSVAENLDLFRRMRAGEFSEGEQVLRAKIDMASPNLNLRDPVLYRIRKVAHQRTGDAWCLYPLYDFTHGLSDALEGVTHSLCTLEFEDHRPLYDWILDQLETPCRPRQYEFSRLNLQYTVLSKRKLIQLVEEKRVEGWDDPRMPTLSGLRRRGYPPESLRLFCERVGISKAANNIDMGVLEDCVREDLDPKVPRAMVVLRPLKLTITNWPEGHTETLDAPRHPKLPELGRRSVPLSQTVYIEQDDFSENPPEGFQRLTPGGEVRLRNAYVVRCDKVLKDDSGNVTELRCTHDPDTAKGKKPAGRKVKGIVHWVSASHAVPVEVRLYDRLFTTPNPGADQPDGNFLHDLNPDSREILPQAWAEASLADTEAGIRFQFERLGYFMTDPADSHSDRLVFNRIVTLRDSWGTKTN